MIEAENLLLVIVLLVGVTLILAILIKFMNVYLVGSSDRESMLMLENLFLVPKYSI